MVIVQYKFIVMEIERKIIQPDFLVVLGFDFEKKENKTPEDYTQFNQAGVLAVNNYRFP